MREQFIVAGGGIAGLVSSIALARQGHRVTLFEQSRHLGGRGATQHLNGFLFNLGPHALYRRGPLARILRDWEIPFSGHQPRLTSGAYLVDGTRKHTFPSGTKQLLFTGALSFTGKLSAARRLQMLTNMRPETAEGSMRDWLDRHARPGPVRLWLEALTRVTTYAKDLDRLDARAAIQQVQLGIRSGVLYVDGGWETLIAGLASKAKALGVDVIPGTPVERIESGVVHLAGGRSVECAGIVLAVTPDAVERLTGVRFQNLVLTRLACLDLGLRAAPSTYGKFALGVDRPFYLSMHSEFSALAPADHALVHVGKYLGAGETASREELEDFAELVLPGFRKTDPVARFLPDMTVTYGIPTPEGRPKVDALAMSGVALAGDWIGDQAMLADAAAASALQAVEFVSSPESARRIAVHAAG